MEPLADFAAALARLSEAQAKCAKELQELSVSQNHADSPAWASAGIAALVRLFHSRDPCPMEPLVDFTAALERLSEARAKCAKELQELSVYQNHAESPSWASAGIPALVRAVEL